ncbi:hypothetical protein PLESTB_000458400 [Pleodorina starrii]|uniref:Uncharacterized protein n=1 Tax=Pleodorina starrii TaxID=330485 RepID=A0A9W6F069_9CHLO|nr:hypothetical protein PLESTM_000760000 [Pleodorina starrii]GLC51030.1 hypothetical protein PLESTB_000458400 [Pleodorina starrii]
MAGKDSAPCGCSQKQKKGVTYCPEPPSAYERLSADHRHAWVAAQLGLPRQCLGGYLHQSYLHCADQLLQRSYRASFYRRQQRTGHPTPAASIAAKPFACLKPHLTDTPSEASSRSRSPSPERCASPARHPPSDGTPSASGDRTNTLPRPPPPTASKPRRNRADRLRSFGAAGLSGVSKAPAASAPAGGLPGPTGAAEARPGGTESVQQWERLLEGIQPSDEEEAQFLELWRATARFCKLEKEAVAVLNEGRRLSPALEGSLRGALEALLDMMDLEAPDVVASRLLELPPDAPERTRSNAERQVLLLGGICHQLSITRFLPPDLGADMRRRSMLLGSTLLAHHRLPPANMWELSIWSCALLQMAMASTFHPMGAAASRCPAAVARLMRRLNSVEMLYGTIVQCIASMPLVRRLPHVQLPHVVEQLLVTHNMAVVESVNQVVAAAAAAGSAGGHDDAAARRLRRHGRRQPPPPPPPSAAELNVSAVLCCYEQHLEQAAQLPGKHIEEMETKLERMAARQRELRHAGAVAAVAAGARGGWPRPGPGPRAMALTPAEAVELQRLTGEMAMRALQLQEVAVIRTALLELPERLRAAEHRAAREAMGNGGGGGGGSGGGAGGGGGGGGGGGRGGFASVVVSLDRGPLGWVQRCAVARALLGLELEGRCPPLSCAGGPGLHTALAATASLNHIRQHAALPQPFPHTTTAAAAASATAGNRSKAAASDAVAVAGEGSRGLIAFRPMRQSPTSSSSAAAAATTAATAAAPARAACPRLALLPVVGGEALSGCVREALAEAAAHPWERLPGAGAGADASGPLRLSWPRRSGGGGGGGADAPGPRISGSGPGSDLEQQQRSSWRDELLVRLDEQHWAVVQCGGWREMELGTELMAECRAALARSNRDMVLMPLLLLPSTGAGAQGPLAPPPPGLAAACEARLRDLGFDPRCVDEMMESMGADICVPSELPPGLGAGGAWRPEVLQRLRPGEIVGLLVQLRLLEGERQRERQRGTSDAQWGGGGGGGWVEEAERERELRSLWMSVEDFVRRGQPDEEEDEEQDEEEEEEEEEEARRRWAARQGLHGRDYVGNPPPPPRPRPRPGWRARARWALTRTVCGLLRLGPDNDDDEEEAEEAAEAEGKRPGTNSPGVGQAGEAGAAAGGSRSDGGGGREGQRWGRGQRGPSFAPWLPALLESPLLLVAVECERGGVDSAQPVQELMRRRGRGRAGVGVTGRGA